MPLPDRILGADYFLVELIVHGQALTLLLDTGFSAQVLLLESVCRRLGLLGAAEASGQQLIGATGNVWMRKVDLDEPELAAPAGSGAPRWRLSAMTGVVTDAFVQQKLAEEVGISLDGMLGQGFLRLCDLELDAGAGALRFHRPATLPAAAPGWTALQSLSLPGNLQGLLLSRPEGREPVLGILDSGASHTVVNVRAASALGLDAEVEQQREEGTLRQIRGIGLDNSQMMMPLVRVAGVHLRSATDVSIDRHPPPAGVGGLRSWSFGNLTCPSREPVGPFHGIRVAIGDLSLFGTLLSQPQESIGDFQGAVALIGQDLLTQLPVRISWQANLLCFKHVEPRIRRSAP